MPQRETLATVVRPEAAHPQVDQFPFRRAIFEQQAAGGCPEMRFTTGSPFRHIGCFLQLATVNAVSARFACADSPMHHRSLYRGPALLPSFIRAVEDLRGVRIVRLQGPVGMEIGQEEREAEKASQEAAGAFSCSLLLDFKATTAWDSSTIASLVKALRRRLAAHAKVGIINAPPKLLALLEISRLLDMFPIYSSEAMALAKLAATTNISIAAP